MAAVRGCFDLYLEDTARSTGPHRVDQIRTRFDDEVREAVAEIRRSLGASGRGA